MPGILHDLLDLFLPRQCELCEQPLHDHEDYVCTWCLSQLARTGFHSEPDNALMRHLSTKVYVRRGSAHFSYSKESNMAKIVHIFKYRNKPGLARHMGRLMAREMELTGFFSDIDVIIPVPIHFTRRMSRGYNQSEMLARGVSDVTGIPLSTALRCRRYHRSQALAGSHRHRQVDSTLFRLDDPEALRDRHVLLIDDVFTTGATMASAVTAITEHFRAGSDPVVYCPGITVSVLTLAYAG